MSASLTKYEYIVKEIHEMSRWGACSGPDVFQSYLNHLGEAGWQMVSNDGSTAIFMREKVEEEKG